MRWITVYTVLIGIGLVVMGGSFFFPLSIFLILFSIGLIITVGATVERIALRKNVVKSVVPPELKPIAKTMPTEKGTVVPQGKKHFFSIFFHKPKNQPSQQVSQQPKQETPIAGQIQLTAQQQPQKEAAPAQEKKEGINIFIKNNSEDEQKKQQETLAAYIKKSLKQQVPKEKIKELALQSNWSEELFEKVFKEVTDTIKEIKIVILSVILLLVFVAVVILAKYGLFVVPYWINQLKGGSPVYYIGFSLVLFAIILFMSLKIKKSFNKKQVEYKVIESKNVEEIRASLQKYAGSYETDLDKLYKVLTEKGKLTTSEVAQAFNISKEQAEEWGKILRDQDLITLHYPTVGDPELIWKKLKSIESPLTNSL